MRTLTFSELVAHNEIELDGRIPVGTYTVDESMGTDTRGDSVPVRQRDG
jgi:cation transport ATPase